MSFSSGDLQSIPVSHGQLSAFAVGEGPSLIFLHGGPGDTHDYMRRMAEPLFADFRCLFFDQRGTGRSQGFNRTSEEFKLERLFEDLKAVQEYFRADEPILVGHSWGAMYALYACLRYPGHFKKAALLNMGPLDVEMERATSERLISALNEMEKSEWQRLRLERNQARDARNFALVESLDEDLMRLRVKAWVFNPELRDSFLNEYFQDPPADREVNKLIWEAQDGWFSWQKLAELRTPLWLCVGENDSVPVAQAERLSKTTDLAQLSIFKECGHIPWLEHPEKFYAEFRRFLLEEDPE